MLAFQTQLLNHYLTTRSTMGENIPVHKKFNTELTDYSVEHHGDQGVYADNLEVDALVVGAGFAGIFMLKTLRDKGYKTVVYEAGNDTGGTWRWNCYPGAGVDSEVPTFWFCHHPPKTIKK
jgi:hypothetical protein